jgi:hypothetical protein
MNLKTFKWWGTALCLIGIALTSVNIYPLNIVFGLIGSGIWTLAGYMQDDTPLLLVELVATVFYFAGLSLYIYTQLSVWLV